MDISVAGMQAASQWFSASASNIVAITSAPLTPQQPAGAPAQSPPTFPLSYSPQAPYANMQGMVASPDGDLATQMVNLHLAANSFQANLLALKVSSRMVDNLLDIVA